MKTFAENQKTGAAVFTIQKKKGGFFMAGQAEGRKTAGIMEYLLKLLHKEWERSGRTKAGIRMDTAGGREVGKLIAEEIQKRQGQLETEEMPIRQSMGLSKENFILLRLAKKIKKEGDKAARREAGTSFTVELDKEEYRLYCALVKEREA